MMFLGHLGLGVLISRPFLKSKPDGSRSRFHDLKWLMLGALLPDLIDKPLYYGLSWVTGRSSRELGLISGTRTFGHMFLLPVILGCCLWVLPFLPVRQKSGQEALARFLRALALGVLSHDALDLFMHYVNLVFNGPSLPGPSVFSSFFFPLLGVEFPWMPYASMRAHLGQIALGPILIGELTGATALVWLFTSEYSRPRGKKSKAAR